MTSPPPTYPRVAHLAPALTVEADDVVARSDQRAAIIGREVVVEEKLDGMNVMVWLEDGAPKVGTRGGEDTSDRSGERGRIRAWAVEHRDELAAALHPDGVLYAEWLRRRHGVPYERLPAPLVGLDVLDVATGEFLDIDARDERLRAIGLPSPPVRFRGRLSGMHELTALLGPSAFAEAPAEGLVIRTADGREPRILKLLDPVWAGIGSVPWNGENRVLVAGALKP